VKPSETLRTRLKARLNDESRTAPVVLTMIFPGFGHLAQHRFRAAALLITVHVAWWFTSLRLVYGFEITRLGSEIYLLRSLTILYILWALGAVAHCWFAGEDRSRPPERLAADTVSAP
jgi:hypothetical protein